MKKRNFFHWMSLAGAVVALVCGAATGNAVAAPKTVPTCNGWADALQTVPAYCDPATQLPGYLCPAGAATLCTDFYGKGNYANSPLPAGPIDTAGFTIVNGGSGYIAPVVTVTDYFTGTVANPAACSASVDANGSITGVTCAGGGSGYMAPVVTITDIGPGGTLALPTCGGIAQPACGSGAWLETKLSAAGPLVGGIRKFQDNLPDLKGALATPDVTTFPGSDYYEIALVKTTTQMHTDLPATPVVGYVQFPSGSSGCSASPLKPYQYLGPIILAQKDRPVRVKFTNCLAPGSGGDLFLPVDTTYMGAGSGPTTPSTDPFFCADPTNEASCYQQNRATLHLHGGNTPWISDGTPNQWTVPYGDTSAAFKRGDSTQFVPDMFFDASGKVSAVPVPQCSATVTTNCYPGATPAGLSNDPGLGSMTFYWTNQQGGRLMFYHDHAYGTTRLNVYAGEAAGYLVADPVQETGLKALNVPGTVSNLANLADPVNDLAHLIPLVIQDKTFVPGSAQLAAQDPTWIWGTGTPPVATGNGNLVNGDLWATHVYPPNQNPNDLSGSTNNPLGANGFGRWDYGVWFVPGQNVLSAAGPGPLGPNTAVTIPCTSSAFPGMLLEPTEANKYQGGCPIIPNPSGTPEGFMDTPLVNGKAYPVLTVNPEAYRFQILSAGNDRSWNLQLYVADATGTEVAMLPAAPPPLNGMPLCTRINQPTQPGLGIGLTSAILDATGEPINGTGLLGTCWPNYGQSAGIPIKQFQWPDDGRDGGVPDPRQAGPAIVQIATEGGLLPAPVVIPSTPANYEENTRSVTITNISTHGLWIGPAERADVVIDFTRFANKTLILYNDAPAPAPAFDMRLDYFTGAPDESSTGGAPTTLPGYGPNTRTVMKIVVGGSGSGQPAFKVAPLAAPTGLPALFAATQPTVVVPEPAYPAGSGHSATTNYVQNFQATDLTFKPTGPTPGTSIVAQVAITANGSGYSSATTVAIDPPACTPAPGTCVTALATPKIGAHGAILGINVTNVGAGYGASVPNVVLTDYGVGGTVLIPACGGAAQPACGSGASATAIMAARVPFELKAIQELFTLDYGRMNATMGTEIPFTTFNNQTTLPFGYTDWATEIVQKDTPQLWYLYHNGVDTHFVHFHLFNVQVINRIGWDGTVRPIDQNELGWKDTVRMNPLENILLAIKPITPTLPFPLPDSVRLQDTTKPAGTSPDMAMSGIDPLTGNALANGQTNQLVNFGWEYVWHCHILGHEENDMMRPMIYQVPPNAPTNLAAVSTASGVLLSWSDTSASETEYTVQRDTVPTFNSPALTPFTVNATSANTTGFSTSGYGQTVTLLDPTVVVGHTYYYRLQATDDFAVKSPLTAQFQTVAVSSPYVTALPVAILIPPTVTFTGAPPSAAFGTSFNVTATTNSSSVPVITGTAGICSVVSTSGNAASTVATISMISGTGTCTLTASWAADPSYTSAQLTQTTAAALAVPAVTFTGAPVSAPFPGGFTVTATSSAGVAPSILGNAVCSVGAVTGTSPATAPITMASGSGVCNLQANWPATTNYLAASLAQSTSTQVVITTATPLPNGITGTAYNQALAATGAVGPYTWALSSGTLPAPLTLNPVTGVIAGTPTTAGTYNFGVTATATNGIAATKALSITVVTPVSITTASLPGGSVGVAYNRTVAATGGTTPYVWSISAGALPTPLTLNASTGVISGTPNANGTFSFTVKVASPNGTSATKAFVITIGVPAAPSNLTAVIASATQINLTWTDNSNNETSFSVWRSTNGGPASATTVARTPAQGTSTGGTVTFSDTTVVAGNSYAYYVTAVNAAGASTPSATVTVLFSAPVAPTLASVTAVVSGNNANVTVTWVDVANETTYTVQRATNAAFTTGVSTTNNIAANTTSTVQTVARATTYYYQVRAVNPLGTSGWSNAISIHTP